MTLIRRAARPLLATVFITGGLDQLRNPASKAPAVQPVAEPVRKAASWLPEDPEQLVRINGAVQLTAGTLLALGRFPRLSALALAASVVPTTVAGHRFWEETDPKSKTMHRVQFQKNLGLLGGLLLAAVDTGGDPSLVWRAKHAAKDARRAGRSAKNAAAAAPARALKAVA